MKASLRNFLASPLTHDDDVEHISLSSSSSANDPLKERILNSEGPPVVEEEEEDPVAFSNGTQKKASEVPSISSPTRTTHSSNIRSFYFELRSTVQKENATRTQINSALRRLSLKQGFSVLELRDAYFEAAKKCHPDANQDDDEVKARSSDLFLKVTEAYELLRKYPRGDISSSSEIDEDEYYEKNIISKTEEQFYRDAVYETLGMRAEDLEESKKCPMFRIWLAGGSHTAFHFNLFLMRHGGLAPMLGKKKTTALIGEGKRRRRKR